MPNNKVVYGGKTLIDLTADTVTPETLQEGTTAHDKSGTLITGNSVPFSGEWNDIKGKPRTFPPSAHNQSANSIMSGTFAGQVAAKAGSQPPGVYCVRNQKVSLTAENPTVEGQICWLAK